VPTHNLRRAGSTRSAGRRCSRCNRRDRRSRLNSDVDNAAQHRNDVEIHTIVVVIAVVVGEHIVTIAIVVNVDWWRQRV
jgi:hypothetical protein